MSKIMRVIEIEDNCDGMSLEEALHDLNDCVFPVIGGKSVAFAIEILRALTHGTPIDKGDLIMFDLLMTTIADKELPFEEVLLLIDNAKTPYNPTGDLISREALKDEVRKHAEYYADRTEEDRYNVGYTECACEILDFIDNASTVPERLQGKWVFDGCDDVTCKCMFCGHEHVYVTSPKADGINFCEHCGADMRAKENKNV